MVQDLNGVRTIIIEKLDRLAREQIHDRGEAPGLNHTTDVQYDVCSH
jgi:hypothetical protein